MGFCTEKEYERFLAFAPTVEREMMVNNGLILRKYFLDVSQDEQRRRFEARINDPVKHWKLSPMDTESVRRWWDYTAIYQRMIEATYTPEAPWHIVPSDIKHRARLNLIRHLPDSIPYKKFHADLPNIPRRSRGPRVLPRGWVPASRSALTIEDGLTDRRLRLCSTKRYSPLPVGRPSCADSVAKVAGMGDSACRLWL